MRLAHAGDKGRAEQELFLLGRLIRNGSQFIEARLTRLGITLFEAFFVQDRLLLHELNVERASSPRVAIEQIVAGLLGNYLVQGVDQFHGIMNAAIQSQATDGVIHMRRIAGEKNTAFAKCGGDALVHFVKITMHDVVAPTQGNTRCKRE